MTDRRSEPDIPTIETEPLDPATIGAPEQPPMDDAAGGPQVDSSDEPLPDPIPSEEAVAAQLGDFA